MCGCAVVRCRCIRDTGVWLFASTTTMQNEKKNVGVVIRAKAGLVSSLVPRFST